jgi:quercetin dioxygenase-like cupin family protein
MRKTLFMCGITATLLAGLTSVSHGQSPAKPIPVFEKTVAGMPTDIMQDVRVLTATLTPGQKSVRHTHQFPVTTYVLQGEFTLVVKGQAPVVVKAGEAIIEDPDVEVYAMNGSASGDTKVVIFYASKPQTPFLVPLKE